MRRPADQNAATSGGHASAPTMSDASDGANAVPPRCAGASHAEGGIPARHHSATRVEDVLAEHDVLTGNVLLVLSAAVVSADDAAVGRRPLRPVDPPVLEGELLGRMVAGRQRGDERRDPSGERIDGDDAGAVVLPVVRVRRLIRVAREEPPTSEGRRFVSSSWGDRPRMKSDRVRAGESLAPQCR